MAPLPKKRHSSRRSGKRERVSLNKEIPALNLCPKCSRKKLTHRVCSFCGFYK